mmetsp:Transcript_79596/g.221395  ORF Transcript_79596/g.221395 Transcript_79596/m.221395 type:complete len:111 (+) Transcript_79596:286-618(+)
MPPVSLLRYSALVSKSGAAPPLAKEGLSSPASPLAACRRTAFPVGTGVPARSTAVAFARRPEDRSPIRSIGVGIPCALDARDASSSAWRLPDPRLGDLAEERGGVRAGGS